MDKKLKTLNICVVTLSDRASKGEYKDLSGGKVVEMVNDFFSKTNWQFKIEKKLISDDKNQFLEILQNSVNDKVDIVISTGGTGVGKRDISPETAQKVIKKELCGIMENVRLKYGQKNPNALLSRSIAGVANETQIYVIPGSLKAVNEYMTEILKTIEHLVFMIHGVDNH